MPTIFESSAPNSPKGTKKKLHSPMGPLTSFSENPDGVRFETQEEKEVVVLFLREHFIVNLPWIFIAAVLIVAPTVIFPILGTVLRPSFALPTGYVVVGTLLWYLATFGFILAKFLSWFFNIYIVTNERVVDIDFYYLLYKNFAEAELTRIQDISFVSGGIIATIFNYGNVTIETAGEAPNLEFTKVPHPDRVVETIRNLTEQQEGEV